MGGEGGGEKEEGEEGEGWEFHFWGEEVGSRGRCGEVEMWETTARVSTEAWSQGESVHLTRRRICR